MALSNNDDLSSTNIKILSSPSIDLQSKFYDYDYELMWDFNFFGLPQSFYSFYFNDINRASKIIDNKFFVDHIIITIKKH